MTEPTQQPPAQSITVDEEPSKFQPVLPSFSVERIAVEDDLLMWSTFKKNAILFFIVFVMMVAALPANIQNPAINNIEAWLHATPAQFSLNISTYILVQSLLVLIWNSISEIKGRKLVYAISLALFTFGSIGAALSHNIGSVIGFRCLQAAGSPAVVAIGPASLTDIFEAEKINRKMAIFRAAPLSGQVLGPFFGGILTTVWGWPAIFWFLAILCGTCFIAFVLLFRETLRPERSLIHQSVLKQHLECNDLRVATSSIARNRCEQADKLDISVDVEKNVNETKDSNVQDVVEATKTSRTLCDISPFKPVYLILLRPNNALILLASGILYAFDFQLAYDTSRRLGDTYGYNAFKIGLVTISYGAGIIMSSVLNGSWADRQPKDVQLKAHINGKTCPEMRFRNIFPCFIILPLSALAFGWLCDEVHHIATITTFLFIRGFFCTWMYSGTMDYLVYGNPGRSSAAVAANNVFRGIFAFIAIEFAVPLQDAVGNGWLYTIWAGILILNNIVVLLVWLKGGQWRENAELREKLLLSPARDQVQLSN